MVVCHQDRLEEPVRTQHNSTPLDRNLGLPQNPVSPRVEAGETYTNLTSCQARLVPFALHEEIEDELDQLEAEGIIKPMQFSDWTAPIVPVLKCNGRVRICGDYELTVNRVTQLDHYPLLRIEVSSLK